MKCPSCGKKAIGLWDWAKGVRWYRTKCDSCGQALKASRGTWLGILAGVAWGIGAAVAYDLSVAKGLTSTLIMIGIFVVVGLATYYTVGGYEIYKRRDSRKRPAEIATPIFPPKITEPPPKRPSDAN